MICHPCVTVSVVARSNEQQLLKQRYGNRLLLFRCNCNPGRRHVLVSTINCSGRCSGFKLLPSLQRLILTASLKRKVLWWGTRWDSEEPLSTHTSNSNPYYSVRISQGHNNFILIISPGMGLRQMSGVSGNAAYIVLLLSFQLIFTKHIQAFINANTVICDDIFWPQKYDDFGSLPAVY
jgi:hypothetical protein